MVLQARLVAADWFQLESLPLLRPDLETRLLRHLYEQLPSTIYPRSKELVRFELMNSELQLACGLIKRQGLPCS